MVIESQSGPARGDLRRLFEGGSIVGLSDGELLDRFLSGDGGAFSILVDRLGPMVWVVCRRMLRDERDAENSYQATFLIMARRTHFMRNRDVVASWLYSVAVRGALRAGKAAVRRSAHERHAAVVEARADVPGRNGTNSGRQSMKRSPDCPSPNAGRSSSMSRWSGALVNSCRRRPGKQLPRGLLGESG